MFGSESGVEPALRVMNPVCSHLHFIASIFASLLYHVSLRQDTSETLRTLGRLIVNLERVARFELAPISESSLED